MSPDEGEVQPPLDNHPIFQYFPKLAAEIRLEILDLASPGIIDVYCTEDGLQYGNLHPFLTTCSESRRFYLRGVTYFERFDHTRGTYPPKIPFNFERDYFCLHCPHKHRGETSALSRLLRHARNVILSPERYEDIGWLNPGDFEETEVRVCLADIPNQLILSPLSAFRRGSPSHLWLKQRNTCLEILVEAALEEKEYEQKMKLRYGLSSQVPLLPVSWTKQLRRQELCRDMFKKLKSRVVRLDEDLPYKPTVEEIKKARLPMLVYLQHISSATEVREIILIRLSG